MRHTKMIFKQIKILTVANMKSRYRKTFVGFLWVVLNPVLMYSVQALVFNKFLNLNLPNYYIFLLGGLLPWIFINSSWDSCTTSIVNASGILKSFQVSPLVILCSSILDNFVNFLAALIILIIPTVLFTHQYTLSLLLLPTSIMLLVAFTLLTTSVLAVLHVFYRDVKYVANFTMSIVFFLTPIFYPPSFIPENLQWINKINPFYLVLAPIRASLLGEDFFEIFIMQLKSLILIILILLVFLKIWKKRKNELFLKL